MTDDRPVRRSEHLRSASEFWQQTYTQIYSQEEILATQVTRTGESRPPHPSFHLFKQNHPQLLRNPHFLESA